MSEVGNVDFATLDGAIDASAVDNSTVDSAEVETLETEASSETGDQSETEQSSDGSEQNTETAGKTAAVAGKDGAVPETAQQKQISQVLKSLVDNDPTAKGTAKLLRDAYFGKQAYDKEFGSVTAARNTKAFLSEVAGQQGPVTLEQARDAFSSTQSVIQNIEESDRLVHAGDPAILDNILEDLRSEGNEASFSILGSHYLDKMAQVDPDGYVKAMVPHLADMAKNTGMEQAISEAWDAIQNGDTKLAAQRLQGLHGLVKSWKDKAGELKQANSEQAKIQTERQKWNDERAQGERKAFKTETATTLEKTNNVTLGKDLSTYLRMPFFKALPQTDGKGRFAPWKIDLGNGIKAELYKTLEVDQDYQRQMKALWGSKTPDKAKITQYHNDKLQEISANVVKRVIEARYPNYAKGGSAAGRVAASKAKSEASAKASAASVATGRPVYVAQRPTNLIREQIVVGGKTYNENDLQILQIGGKGFIRGTNGLLRFVTWRR